MKFLRSHLTFNRSQRDGILRLLALNLLLLGILKFVDFSENEAVTISSEELIAIQAEIDSLKQLQKEKMVPKIYPFNPNFITDYKAYSLGMTSEEFDRLSNFRSKGQWINSAGDFKRVTAVSDSLLRVLKPLFKFPDWVTNPRSRRDNYAKNISPIAQTDRIDLNNATIQQLEEISGVGKVLSERIINYRAKLGGFSSDMQLYSVYGLREDVVSRILGRFTVQSPKEIQKFNINEATASDIATIPGISFDLAKEIWEFRRLREHISDLSELQKIETLTDSKFRLITVYLYAE